MTVWGRAAGTASAKVLGQKEAGVSESQTRPG